MQTGCRERNHTVQTEPGFTLKTSVAKEFPAVAVVLLLVLGGNGSFPNRYKEHKSADYVYVIFSLLT